MTTGYTLFCKYIKENDDNYKKESKKIIYLSRAWRELSQSEKDEYSAKAKEINGEKPKQKETPIVVKKQFDISSVMATVEKDKIKQQKAQLPKVELKHQAVFSEKEEAKKAYKFTRFKDNKFSANMIVAENLKFFEKLKIEVDNSDKKSRTYDAHAEWSDITFLPLFLQYKEKVYTTIEETLEAYKLIDLLLSKSPKKKSDILEKMKSNLDGLIVTESEDSHSVTKIISTTLYNTLISGMEYSGKSKKKLHYYEWKDYSEAYGDICKKMYETHDISFYLMLEDLLSKGPINAISLLRKLVTDTKKMIELKAEKMIKNIQGNVLVIDEQNDPIVTAAEELAVEKGIQVVSHHKRKNRIGWMNSHWSKRYMYIFLTENPKMITEVDGSGSEVMPLSKLDVSDKLNNNEIKFNLIIGQAQYDGSASDTQVKKLYKKLDKKLDKKYIRRFNLYNVIMMTEIIDNNSESSDSIAKSINTKYRSSLLELNEKQSEEKVDKSRDWNWLKKIRNINQNSMRETLLDVSDGEIDKIYDLFDMTIDHNVSKDNRVEVIIGKMFYKDTRVTIGPGIKSYNATDSNAKTAVKKIIDLPNVVKTEDEEKTKLIEKLKIKLGKSDDYFKNLPLYSLMFLDPDYKKNDIVVVQKKYKDQKFMRLEEAGDDSENEVETEEIKEVPLFDEDIDLMTCSEQDFTSKYKNIGVEDIQDAMKSLNLDTTTKNLNNDVALSVIIGQRFYNKPVEKVEEEEQKTLRTKYNDRTDISKLSLFSLRALDLSPTLYTFNEMQSHLKQLNYNPEKYETKTEADVVSIWKNFTTNLFTRTCQKCGKTEDASNKIISTIESGVSKDYCSHCFDK